MFTNVKETIKVLRRPIFQNVEDLSSKLIISSFIIGRKETGFDKTFSLYRKL
jgi:hypothetical protein